MVKRQWIIFNVRQTDQSRMSSIGSLTPLRSACMGVCRQYVTAVNQLPMVGSLHRPEGIVFGVPRGGADPPPGSGPNAKKYAIATVSAYRGSMPPIRSIPGESISLPPLPCRGRSHPRSVLRGIFTKMAAMGCVVREMIRPVF
jgi:hypothetical protein